MHFHVGWLLHPSSNPSHGNGTCGGQEREPYGAAAMFLPLLFMLCLQTAKDMSFITVHGHDEYWTIPVCHTHHLRDGETVS